MSKFIATIGSNDETLLEVGESKELLVEARDKYYAHKEALLKCYPGQEVLQLRDDVGKIVFDIKNGFM